MVSSYLKRPIRTLKQAQKDRAQGRRRSKAAKSAAKFTMSVLPKLVVGYVLSARGMPSTPTDREAA